MATDTATPIEVYWNSQKEYLKKIREQLGDKRGREPAAKKKIQNGYRPLSNEHPLLKGSTGPPPPRRSPAAGGRKARTPPARLTGLNSPNDRHSPSLRGNKYDIIPPVHPRKIAFQSPTPQNDEDSWGDTASSESDSDAPAVTRPPHAAFPYPVVMYPMMLGPQPQSSRRSRDKQKPRTGSKKKRVRYRNTPTVLQSRETSKHKLPTRTPRGEGNPLRSPNFQYVSHSYDPFDPRSNSVLARYSMGAYRRSPEPDYHHQPGPDILTRDHPFYASSFYACEDFMERELLLLIKEVVKETTRDLAEGYLIRKIDQQDPLADWLDELLDDVVYDSTVAVVKDVTSELVDQHLHSAACKQIIHELADEIIDEDGDEIVREAVFEKLVEDIIDEELVDLEVESQGKEVIIEVLTHYNDKVRRKEVREVKKMSSDKQVDGYSLDYLLAMIVRQGQLWTEGEHANKLLDSFTLSIVLEQFLDVGNKRHRTVDNKPLRRLHEKAVTDVAVDGLLEELCQSLDQDMGDLDEYEQGLETVDSMHRMPTDREKWFKR